MKKYFYYITPFILTPTLLLLCEYLSNNTNFVMNLYFCVVITLALLSAILGNLSPTAKKFDYLMTVIMPLSLLCFMFIGGFLDKSDLGSRFHFDRAFRCAFQPSALILYGVTGLITFLSSYKGFRVVKLLKSKMSL